MRMLAVKFFVLFNSFIYISSSSSSLRNSKNVNRYSSVSDNTIEIINSCYSGAAVHIILSGEIDNKITQSFYQLNKPISMINRLENNHSYNQVLSYNHPGLFFIVTSSAQNLDNYLINMRNFPLWDIYQPFFILDTLTHENECRNALEFLQISWRYNLLNAFFLCNQNDSTFIWILNPFITTAPDPWKHFKFTEDLLVKWTLHYQQYQSHSKTKFCTNLLWDKTDKTDGFEVKTVMPRMSTIMYNFSCATVYYNMIQSRVLKMLNVSIKKTCMEEGNFFRLNAEGTPSGLAQLAAGFYDVAIMIFFGRYVKNSTAIHLNTMSYIVYVVPKKGSVLAVVNILHYLGWELLIATVVITTMTMLVLRYFMEQSVALLILETIRLLSNTGVLKLPSTDGLKFFFFPVFCFFLLLQGIFQGKLSALLTISLPERNLETLEDLKVHNDYTIYVARTLSHFLNEEFKNRSITTTDLYCTNELTNDKKAVCITNFDVYVEMINLQQFDLSTESFYSAPYFIYTRKDWPLQQKFEKYMLALTENGYIHKWGKKWNSTLLQPRKSLLKLIDEARYSVLELTDVNFAFYGLIIGHGLATIIFLIENKSWRIFIKIFQLHRNFIKKN